MDSKPRSKRCRILGLGVVVKYAISENAMEFRGGVRTVFFCQGFGHPKTIMVRYIYAGQLDVFGVLMIFTVFKSGIGWAVVHVF